MKKIAILVLTVFALAACKPDNWFPESFNPGTSTNTGSGSNSGNNSGSNNGSGSNSGSNNSSNKTYKVDEVLRALIGGWSMKDGGVEYKLHVNTMLGTHWTMESTKLKVWREGIISGGDSFYSNGKQLQLTYHCSDEYQEVLLSDGWSVSTKEDNYVFYMLDVPELMENHRIHFEGDNGYYTRDNNVNITKNPYD